MGAAPELANIEEGKDTIKEKKAHRRFRQTEGVWGQGLDSRQHSTGRNNRFNSLKMEGKPQKPSWNVRVHSLEARRTIRKKDGSLCSGEDQKVGLGTNVIRRWDFSR